MNWKRIRHKLNPSQSSMDFRQKAASQIGIYL
jgi:hypothetical protein